MTAPLDLVDRKAMQEAIRPSYPCTQDSAAEAVCDALGDIETRIAAIPSHPAPAGEAWLPIETAPRDGTRIDAWVTRPDALPKICKAWREVNVYWHNTTPDGGVWLSGYANVIDWCNEPRRQYDCVITHWKPIDKGPLVPPTAPGAK